MTGLTLGDIRERDVLKRIFPRLPVSAAQLVGPGDDAAVLVAPDGRYVVTTDMMIHGPDFRLAWSSPEDLGWKAAASNLSDVAAMGARPTALVVAIAAPGSTLVADLEGIADGLRLACEALAPGCGVVGGDLSVSDTLTIAVTAFGDLEGRDPVLRSGAVVGDMVAVAGQLGVAGRGIRALLEYALDETGAPDAALARAVRDRLPDAVEVQLRPTPPIGSGAAAVDAGVHAMLDLSDGLAIDAARIAEASEVAIDFESTALGDTTDAVHAALDGGEDHGLLACFPPDATLPVGFRRIGVVVANAGSEAGVLVDGVGYTRQSGWDVYRGWDGRKG